MFPRLMTVSERDRLAEYDGLKGNLDGMRQALDTQQRALDDAHLQLDSQREQFKKLQQDYLRLETGRSESASGERDSVLLDVFKRLQGPAVQLPTIRAAVSGGAQLGAWDVLGVVAPLEVGLHDLGFEPIGAANQTVEFDPTIHHSTGGQGVPLVSGENVRIRYVGYRFKDQIVCKAEVTRLEQVESA
jgi:hypothetical protein